MKEIYLAGGCFWGVEAYFRKIYGIIETKVGYANGKVIETNYNLLKQTEHAETVYIRYDSNKIHLAEILDRFERLINPVSLNKQGGDIGVQYRTGIYYVDDSSKRIAEKSLEVLDKVLNIQNVIELEKLEHFILAEDYHQTYLEKNPNGYCHINILDAYKAMYPARKPSFEEIREKLSELQYGVTQNKDTERPFSSAYDQFTSEGIYVDIVSGQPLFSSLDKYDAGCGWPSFTMPITTDAMEYEEDNSRGRIRTEVLSSGANSHMGHVFSDGPIAKGGLRYCMNGASMRFIAKEDMEEEGYTRLLPYITR